MISVILAGGKGLRLWPESRKEHPKQICKFIENKSMLDHTIDRLITAGSEHIIIITSDALLGNIEQIVKERTDAHLIEILSEPEGKNTAPAAGLILSKYYRENQDAILGFFPADHHVLDIEAFTESINRGILTAKNDHLVTIGIPPTRPETGFGYIERTKWEIGEIPGVYQVNSFCEKPDLQAAKSYLTTGQHMWNAGIYMGKARVLLEEFQKYLPEIFEKIAQGYDKYINSYSDLPDISLDYAIAEKSNRMAVIPGNFGWCDLGSWDALAELHKQDNKNNVCTGKDIIVMESNNCIVKQSEKTVVLYGLQDVLLVETDDIILVADRNKSQDVRNIVDYLKQQKRFDLL